MRYISHQAFPLLGDERGNATITPTSATHVYVDANHNSLTDLSSPEGLRIMERNIPYSVSAHLYLHEDGWNVKGLVSDERQTYVKRLDRYDLEPTSRAVEAIERLLIRIVTEWVEAHPQQLLEAACIDFNNDLWRVSQEEAELNEKLAHVLQRRHALETNLRDADERLSRFLHPAGKSIDEKTREEGWRCRSCEGETFWSDEQGRFRHVDSELDRTCGSVKGPYREAR